MVRDGYAANTMEALLVVLAVLSAASQDALAPPARPGATPAAPKRLKSVRPMYPADALRAGLEGGVVLECVLDTKGHVDTVKPPKGPPPLVASAMSAVKQWRYSPTVLEGRPVRVVITVTVHFRHPGDFTMADLKASLEHHDEYIREAAATALGRLGPRAVDATVPLLRATQDRSERVRTAAREALARVRGGRS